MTSPRLMHDQCSVCIVLDLMLETCLALGFQDSIPGFLPPHSLHLPSHLFGASSAPSLQTKGGSRTGPLVLLFCTSVLHLVARLGPTLCDPRDCSLPGFSAMGILQAGILEWVSMPSSELGIFPTQGLNPGLLHCRQILYCLSHQGSPRILERVF